MDLLKSPVSLLFAAGVAYLLGWIYLDSYYDTFEVAISTLNLPIEHYFTIGFLSLLRGAFSLGEYQHDTNVFISRIVIWSSLAVAVIVWLLPHFDRFERIKTLVLGVALIAGIVAAYVLTQAIATYNAMLEPPEVQVQLNSSAEESGQPTMLRNVRLIHWDERTIVVGTRECPRNPGDGSENLDQFQLVLRHGSWRISVLPSSQVHSVNFTKSPARTQRELLEEAYRECGLEQAPDQKGPAASGASVEAVPGEPQAQPPTQPTP